MFFANKSTNDEVAPMDVGSLPDNIGKAECGLVMDSGDDDAIPTNADGFKKKYRRWTMEDRRWTMDERRKTMEVT